MKFEMPKAERARLEQLLEYLGDRANDFRKCFDIESEWCWKYADLVLRGMEKRELEYGERHHIVPASLYGKRNKIVDKNNTCVLTYAEHVYVHYCAVNCSIGNMLGNMARAFRMMYNRYMKTIPSEDELLVKITELEMNRIRSLVPEIAKLDKEGRTHTWDDPVKARQEVSKKYWDSNIEKCRAASRKCFKKRYAAKRDELLAATRQWRKENPEKVREMFRKWSAENPEKVRERVRRYQAKHPETHIKANRKYRENHKEEIRERAKAYRENNPEKRRETCRKYRETHKEQEREYQKKYNDAHREEKRERGRKYREEKIASGYRRRKDPVTGKHVWVFVGLPEQEVAA